MVEAEGLAPYNAGDIIQTKRASLLDAQRNAVEKVVGVFVSARTMVEKAVAIESNILGNTQGYVKKYEILKEGNEDGLYKTKIRALVALQDLEQDLKEMSLLNTTELKRPRVSMQMTERIEKQPIEEHPAFTAIQRQLVENGFVIVDSDLKSEADLSLSGVATAYPFQSTNLGGFVSYRARVAVDITRAGTKDVVLSLSKEASGLGGNDQLAALKALETVGNLAGEEIAGRLAASWIKNKNLYVYVENVPSFTQVDRIKKHLSAQPGVDDLVLRLFDEGMAQFELQLGSIQPSDLASRLEAGKTLSLKVLETKPQTIRLRLE